MPLIVEISFVIIMVVGLILAFTLLTDIIWDMMFDESLLRKIGERIQDRKNTDEYEKCYCILGGTVYAGDTMSDLHATKLPVPERPPNFKPRSETPEGVRMIPEWYDRYHRHIIDLDSVIVYDHLPDLKKEANHD